MSTRSCSTGIVASSLAMLAAVVARSASFWPCWRSISASLAFCSARWLIRNWRCISICAGLAPSGGSEVLKWIVRERRAQSRDVELGGDEIALLALLVGLGHRRIELDQNVAGLDALSVANVDRANHAGLERLDHLGAAARNDLARRGGDDIDAAERGPHQRDAEQRDDRRPDRAADRRRRRLGDLECRRQEGEFVLAAANLGSRKRR